MEKIITFCVPCYNSAEFMDKCINLLSNAGEEVEVLIIDDGSKDNTLTVAKKIETEFPNVVKVIHQENKGHGGAVATGILNAKGKYFKVIDSDDWAKTEDVLKVVETIKQNDDAVDLYILNYVYERVYENSSIVVDYRKNLPINKIFEWKDIKKFPFNKVLMMHSLVYRTELLRTCGLSIPEHTFYVDNYFSYQPLPHCKKIFYIDNDFYHYFLGRPGQSCSDENLYKNYKMQMTVTDAIFESYNYNEVLSFGKQLSKYMFHALQGMYLIMLVFCFGGKTNIKQRKLDYLNIKTKLKNIDIKLYKKTVRFFPTILLRCSFWSLKRLLSKFGLAIRNKLSL